MTSEVNEYMLNGGEAKEPSKSWERPWTTDEIRKNSDKWSLAGDVGLLKHLQDFSHHLISRTHEMEKVVDGLVHQSKDTSAKVNNVINDFQMLSNLKFVENRVYDEDIIDGTKNLNLQDQPKSKEQREAEMLARVKQALDLGLSVLDLAFEKIEDLESSDSEGEDMSQGRTRLEPKDFYEHRPLPFVIGSDEFQNDEYAGLRYLIDDEPVYELSAQDDNVSSISEDSESDVSDNDDDFEFVEKKPVLVDEPIVIEPPKKEILHEKLNRKLSDSERSDLFGGDEEEENGYNSAVSIDESPKENKSTDAFLRELGNKIKPTAAPPAVINEKPKEKPPSINIAKKSIDQIDESDDLFASEDNFLNDDVSPFRKDSGLFRTNIKFDSSNDNIFSDQGLFGKTDQKPTVKKEAEVDKKIDSNTLFGDDDDEQDLFGSFSSSTISTEHKKSIPKVNSSQSFESANKVVSPSPAGSTKGSIRSISSKAKSEDSLFGPDSDNELFSSAGAYDDTNSNFDHGPPAAVIDPKTISFDFENDKDEDLFGTLDTKEKKSSKLETKGISEITSDVKSNLLFDTSEDFDLFSPKETVKRPKPIVEKKTQVKEPKSVRKEPSSSIFDESSGIDLFSPAKTAKDVEFMPDDISILESVKVEETSPKIEVSVSNNTTVPLPQKPDAAASDKYQLQKENQLTPIIDVLSSVENQEISFENPVDSTNMLSDLNKDRAKIQIKRRKPTRKGRQAIQSSEEEQDKASETGEESEVKHSIKQTTNSDDLFSSIDFSIEKPATIIPAITHKKKEQQKKDLMSQLMSEAANSRIGKRNSMPNEDDLFSNVSTKDVPELGSDFSFVSPSSLSSSNLFDKPKDSVPDSLTTRSDDFLASNSLSDDELFSDQPSTTFHNLSTEKSPFSPDDSDDIFKIDKGEDAMFQDSDDIFADSNDDIFGNMDKEKYSMFPTSQNVDDDDDDDDIFSNLDKPTTIVTKEKAKNPVKEAKKQNDIFDDPLGLLS